MLLEDCTIALSLIQANRQRMFWLTRNDRRRSFFSIPTPFLECSGTDGCTDLGHRRPSSFPLVETFRDHSSDCKLTYDHPSINRTTLIISIIIPTKPTLNRYALQVSPSNA